MTGEEHHIVQHGSFVLAEHLPALAIMVPLIAAPFAVIVNNRIVAWALMVLTSVFAFYASYTLLGEVAAHGPISYQLGGWEPPFGIEFRVDMVNAFVLLIVSGIGAVISLYAYESVNREIEKEQQPLFYAAMLLCMAGLMGVAITGDAFNLFVFLEISSLSTYVLISMGASRDRRALTASYTYLIMGTVGATFYVIGLGLIYMMTGTLNMADLAERLPEIFGTRTIIVAFVFITVGFGLKLAMFPLHLWLPNAYAFAPSVVTAFLAATATKVAVYALLRFVFTVFGVELSIEADFFTYFLLPLGVIGMFAGSIVAIWQVNAKRLLAYSSIAQIGYMLLGLSFMSATGLTATLLHLFNHALMKGALFLALGAVAYRLGGTTLDKMAGLGKTMPWTMAMIVTGGLSLIGVPLTVGFISKWVLIEAAIEQGWWPVAALIVLSSMLAVVYVWRLIEVAYLKPAPAGAIRQEAPLSLLIPTAMLVIANVAFGLNATFTVEVADLAAQSLIGVDLGGAGSGMMDFFGEGSQ